MKRVAMLMLLCILLTGCSSVFDGHYVSVRPHKNTQTSDLNLLPQVNTSQQLYDEISSMISEGATRRMFAVKDYPQFQLEADLTETIRRLGETDSIADYLVEDITWELGPKADVLEVEINYVAGGEIPATGSHSEATDE